MKRSIVLTLFCCAFLAITAINVKANNTHDPIVNELLAQSTLECPVGTKLTTAPFSLATFVTYEYDPANEWDFGVPLTDDNILTTDLDCDPAPGETIVGPPAPPGNGNVWATDLTGCYPPNSAGEMTLNIKFSDPSGCSDRRAAGEQIPDRLEMIFSYWYQAPTAQDNIIFRGDGQIIYLDSTDPDVETVGWNNATANIHVNGEVDFTLRSSASEQYSGLYVDLGGPFEHNIAFCSCLEPLSVDVSESDTSSSLSPLPIILLAVLALGGATLGRVRPNQP